MSTITLALTILGMGLITFGIRVALFLLPERMALPAWLLRALRYVPAAVLSAIILPELFLPGGTLDMSLGNARLLAGLAAILIAWRTRNVLLTVGVGMVALWLLQSLLGR
ncbi:AzlD domain-containing protein [Promineifilum sp.]|uniref:AzlD domain-containing protein n=1 Tax=Promineifilum sp. TaxID=2664178 RepID=UPI0035B1ED54